jgi:hypothetical protein
MTKRFKKKSLEIKSRTMLMREIVSQMKGYNSKYPKKKRYESKLDYANNVSDYYNEFEEWFESRTGH